MKVLLSDEQKEFASSIRRLFDRECPPSLVRQLQDPSADPKPRRLWDRLAQSGVFGLALPNDVGGGGGTLFDLGLVYEEGGRALCPTIVYSTLEFGLAVSRLTSAPQLLELMPKVAAGEMIGTIALADPGDSSNITPSIRAERQGSKWELSGSLDFVPNADVADMLLTTARARDTSGPAHDVTLLLPREVLSTQRRSTFARDNQNRVNLDGVRIDSANVFAGTEGLNHAHLRWISNATTALHCMDMIGGARAVIDQTVRYIKDRHQFGRPIASFQAAQHHVANMHIAAEGAQLAAYQAVALVGAGRIAERETSIAKLKANEAYKFATLTAHQLHGGMGYVVDTNLHLWSERAKAMELRDGAWDTQIGRLSSALGMRA
ncbi:acyl-CoA dehydrogenase family protein [Bradyrhizobium uaiense]|uniref:Acyl-CoA dehydrogenase n=1 Tax=Bradyrhizobium uaiense TaxID=2594946 RepID=A0A6P1BUU9_9BRAD|nr:acyl-CoA dehydrogenase family protein [Bradyrhizobium uaiense]NEV01383.1 acyl-CoA dehydrogenase [Bradyrhizobium uaiense]